MVFVDAYSAGAHRKEESLRLATGSCSRNHRGLWWKPPQSDFSFRSSQNAIVSASFYIVCHLNPITLSVQTRLFWLSDNCETWLGNILSQSCGAYCARTITCAGDGSSSQVLWALEPLYTTYCHSQGTSDFLILSTWYSFLCIVDCRRASGWAGWWSIKSRYYALGCDIRRQRVSIAADIFLMRYFLLTGSSHAAG